MNEIRGALSLNDKERRKLFEAAIEAFESGTPTTPQVEICAQVLFETMGLPPYTAEQIKTVFDNPMLHMEAMRIIAVLPSDFARHWKSVIAKRSGAMSGNG